MPSVLSGGTSVLVTQAGDEWLALLEALEQPQRTGRIRAVALTSFLGHSPSELDAGGDDLTDELAERVRGWLDLMRSRGVAAVHESLISDGLAARVLSRPQGERLLTDLNHLGQVLHEVAHRESLGLVALLDWLRAERRVADQEQRAHPPARHRREGRPAAHHPRQQGAAVPGRLPSLSCSTAGRATTTEYLFHDGDGRAPSTSAVAAIPPEAAAESAGEELRLTYVALTRAQSQVVTWLAPSWDAGHAGLTRLLFGRNAGEAAVPDTVTRGPGGLRRDGPAPAVAEQGGGVASSRRSRPPTSTHVAMPRPGSARRSGPSTVSVDTAWRRTSYSGLIRAEEQRGHATASTASPR